MPQDLTDDKSTLVQVMAWCRRQQAITWTSVDQDLQRHMASLGPNELKLMKSLTLLKYNWNVFCSENLLVYLIIVCIFTENFIFSIRRIVVQIV